MSASARSLCERATWLAFVALMLMLVTSAHAADESDLLPVDEAFALTVETIAPDEARLRWKIADGYYLYRHRISAEPIAPARAGPLRLPRGKAHRDEFFGDTETYRNELIAILPQIDASHVDTEHASTISLKVKYQGCADIGVCYPPQTRTLDITLPANSATTSGDEDINPIGRALGGISGLGTDANANTGLDGKSAPLPEEQAFGFEAIAGDGNTLLLRFTPTKGYYIYRDRLSITGSSEREPVRIGTWSLPAGTPWKDEHFGQVQVYFNPIDLVVPVLRSTDKALPLTVQAEFQGCQTDGICYPPMRRKVALTLPAGAKITPLTQSLPPTAADAGNAAVTGDANGPGRLLLNLLWALIGGVILNLMPCVLPVLSLKALGLAGSGENPHRARAHALWYTAGVLLSFIALGALAMTLREAGQALGWGFQLQRPLIVALLALVMFAFGLSLSGVWQVGGRWMGVGHNLASRGGAAGDFFTGVLAVIVAAPCTAPFMAPALAWAFTAPTFSALLVFAFLGLGLALPFLLIGFVPALAQRLPKPGAWMETLKQFLAFPMYLTAAWLLWVLTRQRGADAAGWWLLAAIAIALAAWAHGHARARGARWGLPVALLASLAALWPLWAITHLPKLASTPTANMVSDTAFAVPFSEQRLADLRASGRVVLVNITADWCITCKANEKAVFARQGFRDALTAANAVYMVGDWTNVDPAITAFLKQHNAVGVPLYVLYPRGGEGRVLPTVLTAEIVSDALTQAATPAP